MAKLPVLLLTSANCLHDYLEHIRIERESIETALQAYEDAFALRIRKKEQVSTQSLVHQFQSYRKEIIIFHYSGHAGGEHLQLEGAGSAYAKGIAGWLGEMPNLQLVFLNGCATLGQVDLLLQKGVKAVIATSTPVEDRKATEFAIAFYKALAKEETLGQAFQNAKNGIELKHQSKTLSPILDLEQSRGLRLRREETEEFPWGLYRLNDSILDWKLPTESHTLSDQTHLLTGIPFTHTNEIIGRTQQLTKIHQALHQNQNVLLVNGIGGIGKTAVAKAYITNYQKHYQHLAWLTISSGGTVGFIHAFIYENDLIDNLGLRSVVQQHLQNQDQQRALEVIQNNMRQLSGDNLLILDNVNDKKVLNQHQTTLQKIGWKVLLTSRATSNNYTMIPIDELPLPQAKALFYRLYTKEKNDEIVEELLTTIERHTLLTELFAKAAQKAHLSLDGLNQQILKRKKVATGKHGQDLTHRPKEAKVKAYIQYIFRHITELTAQEQTYLRYFSLLPIELHSMDFLMTIFQIATAEEELFEDTVEELTEKGWLINDNGLLRMHPLLQEVTVENLQPTTDNCRTAIEGIAALVHIDQTKDNPIDKFAYLKYGLAVLEVIREETLMIAELWNRVGYIYEHQGLYGKAAVFKEKALAIAILNIENSSNKVVIYMSNLAGVYYNLGRYEEAAKLLEIVLKNVKGYYSKKDPTIAAYQSNLGLVYKNLGRYEEAARLLETALKTDLMNFDENHPTVAVNQSNLGLVYKNLGRYEEAAKLLEIVLKTDLMNFSKKHPNIAVDQSNLALVYKKLGRYKEAVQLLESALKNSRNNFKENHPMVLTNQSNLALVYIATKNYQKAVDLLEKAYHLYSRLLGEDHPNTQIIKGNLDYAKEFL